MKLAHRPAYWQRSL